MIGPKVASSAMVVAGDYVHVLVIATDDTQVAGVALGFTGVDRWAGDIPANAR